MDARGEIATLPATLDPKLQALQTRLQAAITGDSLTLNAATLGTDGARLIPLMQQWLGVAGLDISGSVAVAAQGEKLVLTAAYLETDLLGGVGPGVAATFGVVAQGLSMQLAIDCGGGWSLDQSFPTLGNSWSGGIGFVSDQDDDAAFILASDADPDNARLKVGLNLKAKLVVASGTGAAVVQIIPELDQPVGLLGAARADADIESFSIQGPVPPFTLTLPILPALSFQAPSLSVVSSFGGGPLGTDFVAYVEAGADLAVGSGGVALPLAVRTPTNLTGWRLGLAPGRSVAISDLAAFFGGFTGLSLLSSLPSQVAALSKFELCAFAVQLTPDRSGVSRLDLGMGTIVGDEAANKWTIVPGTGETPILALRGIAFELTAFNGATGYSYQGQVTGTFSLGDTLEVQAQVGIPIGQAPIVISSRSYAALPNLQDIARFLGGQQLADLLPRGLGTLTSYRLDELTFVYDPAASVLERVALGVSAAEAWPIVAGQLEIRDVAMQVSLARPLAGATTPLGSVGGAIRLGSAGDVRVDVYRAAVADPWRIAVSSEEIALPSLGDLAALAGGDVAALLPDTLKDNLFVLSDLALSADVSGGKMESFGFSLATGGRWPVVTGILEVTGAGISMQLTWPQGGGDRQVQGLIWGDVIFCQAQFALSAARGTSDWALSAALLAGQQLTFSNVVETFQPGGWQSLSALGVPDVALVEAAIDYRTGSGDYSLAAAVAPTNPGAWTIALGIGSLSITRIGALVTCSRAANGQPANTKLFVTGTGTIGGVAFAMSYQSGSGLAIEAELVGDTAVPLNAIVAQLCSTDAGTVGWTSAFEGLQAISIRSASAKIVLGPAPSLEMSGTILVDGAEVAAMLVVKQIAAKWEFALAIKVSSSWSLPGFTSLFAPFDFDTAEWMLAASSFTASAFTFPAPFPAPGARPIGRGLNFYAGFSSGNTLPTIAKVEAMLPAQTVPSSLAVRGLLADPLASAYLEVDLVASADGLPLMGWDEVRIAQLGLRLTGAPAFGLHGDFIIRSVKNPDGSVFHLILTILVSATSASIEFEEQPGQGAIFTWQDAFGLNGLTISLTALRLAIIFEPVAFDGTIGGKVEFLQEIDPLNSVRMDELPHPMIVAAMEAARPARALAMPEIWGPHRQIDYARRYDPDGLLIEMKTSFVIATGAPGPVPYRLSGHFHNFTLPYILKRFVDIDIPDLLMPIGFPDVVFDLKLPNPLEPGRDQSVVFDFSGSIEIFGLLGEVAAHFDQSRITFHASMDPIDFKVAGASIVTIIRSEADSAHGPLLDVDSQGPSISGAFYCRFFDIVTFSGMVAVDGLKKFQFSGGGAVGSFASMSVALTYKDTAYLAGSASFRLGTTSQSLPGFSKNGVVVAESVDLSKPGVVIAGTLAVSLDARNPADPRFDLTASIMVSISAGGGCHFSPSFGLDLPVSKDSLSDLPEAIFSHMGQNMLAVFDALLDSAECFVELLKLGLVVLEEIEKIAKVFKEIFEEGIEKAAEFFEDLGSDIEDVVDSFFDIFDSDDSEDNTRALCKAGYDCDQVGDAMKKAVDGRGGTYTAVQLVRDQSGVPNDAVKVISALCSAFPQYRQDAVAAGKLLIAPGGFGSAQVAAGLHAQYAPAAAEAMYQMMVGVFAPAALGPQEMANALAPYYSAADVASQLHRHYGPDVTTAAAMAGYLMPAYVRAQHPLAVGELAGALALFYPAGETATTLRADFSSDTDTAAKLAAVLQAAYAAAGLPLDAGQMAAGLGAAFPVAADIVPTLKTLYPAQTATAQLMAPLLLGVWPQLSLTDMVSALKAGAYPVGQIAAVLQSDYGTLAGTPLLMTQVLAGQGYTPVDVAPVLTTLFPTQCATAPPVVAALSQGFAPAVIAAATMASALVKAPFPPPASAPALKAAYPADLPTAQAMSTLLIAAYMASGGTNPISAQVMAQALAASPYPADGTDGAAAALMHDYPSSTAQALDMSRLLKQAPYAAGGVGRALRSAYPAATDAAPKMATIFAQTPFALAETAPVLKAIYPSETATAAAMYQLLKTAFANPAPTASQMAGALAAAPYLAAETAPVLKTNYPADAGTAAQLAALLKNAYTTLLLGDMLGALVAAAFNAVQVAPAVKSLYAPTAQALATGISQALAGTAPPSAVQLGAALAVAPYAAGDLTAGVLAALPATPAGVMSAVLVFASGATTLPALAKALELRASGKSAAQAAPLVAAAFPALGGSALPGVLNAAYTPPNLDMQALSSGAAAGFVQPDPDAIAQGLAISFPATTAAALQAALVAAWTAAGKTLSQARALEAAAQALDFIGNPMAQPAFATAYAQALGTQATIAAVAGALVEAYGSDATAATMVPALAGAFTGSTLLVDALSVAAAVQQALSLPAAQPAALVGPLAQTFGLTRVPNDVGALALALKNAAFAMQPVSAAMAAYFSSSWTSPAAQVVASVYSDAAWSAAAAQRLKLPAVAMPAAAQSVYAAVHPSAVLMVQALAASFDLTRTAAAIQPMAAALSAVTVSGRQAYPLSDASNGMQAQYAPDWTPGDWQAFAKAYGNGDDMERMIEPSTLVAEPAAPSHPEIRAIVRAAAVGGQSLLEAAVGCRNANFTALQCAPHLYTFPPTPSAADMASVLVQVWAPELSGAGLTAALQACVTATGAPAFTGAQIAAAVAAAISLTFWDVAKIPTPTGPTLNDELKMIGLVQGDLSTITASEGAQFLVFSCLPGDYSPTPGSVVAALQNAYGINIAALAASPAADYRATHNCWISTPLAVPGKTIPYQRLICFESTGAAAAAQIPGVFAALAQFAPQPSPTPSTGPTLVTSMLSTGSAGADDNQVLTALVNGAKGLMNSGYMVTSLRVVVYQAALQQQLVSLFDTLKPTAASETSA
ncbi:MAG TPA: hypothetical protein VGB54_02635 [Allosphingosinicella sp.]|jgi:hypothetical protein